MIWFVIKEGGHVDGGWELPMFATYFDGEAAHEAARKAKAVVVALPIAEDYRDE